MNKTSATVVADSINPQGDRLTSLLITFPRILLSEINTHRMLSKNTSSSRAIPFNKMVKAVQNDPFIPIAWQKEHTGMQGYEYFTKKVNVETTDLGDLKLAWLEARDYAIKQSTWLNKVGVTKQLCNRLLEPFMWTTMLITGSKEGWDNFFNLRCPQYLHEGSGDTYKSKKDFKNREWEDYTSFDQASDNDLSWFEINKGQAEIHMMALAESIYDAMNESNPTQLLPGMYHIPFRKQINELYPDVENDSEDVVKISVSMAARTSYTVVGTEKILTKEEHISLHDRLLTQNPPHSSPMEHCARAMSDNEYYSFLKGNFNQEIEIDADGFIDISTHSNNSNSFGWCRNFKGFIPYRHIIETQNK